MLSVDKRGPALLAICILGACNKPVELDPTEIVETGDDEGILIPNVDLPSADTEGEPDPVHLPTGECIQFPKPHVFGFVHQCEGSALLTFEAGPNNGEDFFTFGPGQSNPQYWIDPDSYDLPLVAACCGQFNYENASFEQKLPYINNCLFDAAQQICRAIPHFLRRQAAKTEDAIEKALIEGTANDAESKIDECLLNLWSGGPTDDDPTRLINKTWSPKNNVTFTVVDAEVFDWTEEGDVTWNTCTGIFDNDPAVIPTAPFQIPGSIAMSQSSLAPGTTMTGSGPFGSTAIVAPSPSKSSLTVAFMADGALRVSGFRLEGGTSTVRVAGEEIEIIRSSVLLDNVMEPHFAGGEYTVDIGDAQFVVTAVFDGDSRVVGFTNIDPIVFRRTPYGDWEFDPFDLGYTEPQIGTWTLSFDGLLFRPRR